MHLFDDIARTDPHPGRRTESQFRFLNRVDRTDFAAVREVMENWFDRFPAQGKADLRQRFRSDDPRQSLGAFWELYLHELHRRLGYQLERDPEVPGTSRRPDYLARRGKTAFYLEATLVSYSDAEMAARRREDVVLDLIDQVFNADFWLGVEIEVAGQATPAKADVIRPIETWLASLEWASSGSMLQPPETDLRARDWVVALRAYAKPDASRGDPLFPTIGTTRRARTGHVDERQRIEDDLAAKATRYGRPDLPFVIAVLCLRDLVEESTVEWALYGPPAVHVPIVEGVGQIDAAFLERNPRGLWQRGQEQQMTRVSAVLTTRHLNPWLVARSELTLWKNPWAAKPLTDEFPWRTVTGDLEQNQLDVTEATRAPCDIVGLDDSWPTPQSQPAPSGGASVLGFIVGVLQRIGNRLRHWLPGQRS